MTEPPRCRACGTAYTEVGGPALLVCLGCNPPPPPEPRCACCSGPIGTCMPGSCDSCCDSERGCIGECTWCDGYCPSRRMLAGQQRGEGG